MKVTPTVADFGPAFVYVESFAHLLSGTDYTAVFQGAIDALPDAGGEIVLSGRNYSVTIASLTVGDKRIVWTGSGARVNGAAIWALPGIQKGFDTTLGREFYNKQDGAALDGTYKDNRRNADYTGGLDGQLDYIERWAITIGADVGSSGNRKAEKAGLFRVDNNSPHANGIALFTAAFAEAQGAVWAVESTTHSKVTPTTYAHRSAEYNIHGYGADTSTLRWIMNLVGHNETTVYSGTPGTDVVGVGLEIYPDSADMKHGIRVRTVSGAGTTKGLFQDAAILVDSHSNDLIKATCQTEPGLVRFGSELSSGIVSQVLGVGNNSAAMQVAYSDIRTEIDDATDGAEDGRLRFYALQAGASTEFFQINAGSAAPIRGNFGNGLKQVTEGADDSGGSGFRVLRVPN